MFRELTRVEVQELMDKGYGYSSVMGGFTGKRKDAIIMAVGTRDLFVDDFDCAEYQELLLEQNADATDYQNYLTEMR